jgi:hypothetical protein
MRAYWKKVAKRFSFTASSLCLSLTLSAVQSASSQTPAPVAIAPVASAPASAAAVPTSDAAAKHAKRTSCLKDAKTKKVVGPEKTAFLKNCNAAP